MSGYLTQQQIDLLLQRIHPQRVRERDGNAYVEGHDIKAELTRIFGFGRWSSEVVEQVCIFEQETVTKSTNKDAWYVAYRSVVKLTISAPDGTPLATYTEGHVGDSTHPQRGEAHGNAVTNSETYALKRCCIPLGDQFGLSLYNKGSRAPFVRWTLVHEGGKPKAETVNTEDVPEVHAESEQVDDQREKSSKPEPPAIEPPAPDKRDAEVTAWREKLLAGPADGKPAAPFYARMFRDASAGKFLNALTEDREGNVVNCGALLNAEQAQARRNGNAA